MSTKWANAAKTTSWAAAPKAPVAAAAADEDGVVARRRAALAAIEREEAEEAGAELEVAERRHQQAERSLSKGKAGASARGDMGLNTMAGSLNYKSMLKNQA